MPTPDFLTVQDMYNRAGARRINGYFDDSNNGTISDEMIDTVNEVLCAAESYYYAIVMKSWAGNPNAVGSAARKLVELDAMVRQHVAWMACEFAAERRTEFTNDEGWGPFKVQFERAEKYLAAVSKGQLRSQAEAETGQGANTGAPGISPVEAQENPFVFTPSKSSPSGHGGF